MRVVGSHNKEKICKPPSKKELKNVRRYYTAEYRLHNNIAILMKRLTIQ